ncbi:unnamed protein product [Clonostachys rhizophaga]|uniref:Histone transcription regulator 3 homolog n=1 Tax=Clonostachys rhizophaga TaxID=160324 RepID=A0A9N9VZ14_9HYPO|nr:unnamed protein product [Clonostachys rhizophaga]
MPGFQAINLEPEENVDDLIDTTKEIHVDEALKRFQNALRLHAQGSRSREAAESAYIELFDSEVFKYREAQTDYERAERHAGNVTEPQSLDSFSAGLDIDAGGADGVAASLSLALYLGYKNYGEFFLDKLKDKLQSDPDVKKARVFFHQDGASKILENWARALDQDPSDPEVWRRAARFGAALNSGRLKRYCLEAAIELDDDPAVMEIEPPSLAEGLAGEQLKDQLKLLNDEIALSHPGMAPWIKKEMPSMIKRHLDPIPYLPDPTQSLTPPPSTPAESDNLLEEDEPEPMDEDHESESSSSWPSLGLRLMKHIENNKAALRICQEIPQVSHPEGGKIANPTPPQSTEPDKKVNEAVKDGSREKSTDETGEKATGDAQKEPAPSQQGSDKPQKERSQSVPATRKRSQSVAGLPDGADEDNTAEKRSKRVRRRETATAEEVADPSTIIANQLQPCQEADSHLFHMVQNVAENLGVEDKSAIDCLVELHQSSTAEDRLAKVTSLASRDLRSVLTEFSDNTVRVLLDKKEKPTLSLSSFLEHAKSGSQDQPETGSFDEEKGLEAFAEEIKKYGPWATGSDIAFEWVKAIAPSYTSAKWSDTMKTTVVQMLNRVDSILLERINYDLNSLPAAPEQLESLNHIIPMLFELHIDIYERITNPNSVVDYATRVETKDRLNRWLGIASGYIQLLDLPPNDNLSVRFLWGSVLVSALVEEPVREHILLMWTSLRDFLSEQKVELISLPNNVVMPIISPAAADREISKLTTMDFFLGLFQEEMKSPIEVIETLEPVLNPTSVHVVPEPPTPTASADDESTKEEAQDEGKPISDCAGQGLRDLWKFLLTSSTELRLFLWSRLGDAYLAIDYPTKKFSCYLKSIEMIVADLEAEAYTKTAYESRRLLLMRTLKSLDEQVIHALTMSLNEPSAFDIIDEEHIKSSVAAVAKVNCLLHVAAICEDDVRVGVTPAPSNSATYTALVNKMREMQVRAWSLQYTLLKAGIRQQGSFISPDNELADLLAAIHHAIGLRKYCKVSNKIFLKVMRAELLKLKTLENWEDYLEQVLYDLYGLKLGVGAWEVQEHGVPHESLEKSKTMQLVERIMILANRMSMKDLLKSDLKTTIDHMQQTIGQLKSTPQMIFNLRNFQEYLKRPIHPLRMYRALTGSIDVDAVSVNAPESGIATHGWFFLQGMLALTKFKGVDLNRRQTPGATDDLRIGATFLRLQLQFTPDRWDAWFRLAECFDYELDEAVLWTADKINKDRNELLKFQRSAIHCYTLALSHSITVDVEAYEGDPLHDLYHKFGMRLYASSREPFAMEPFKHSEQERFFIETMSLDAFSRIVHDEMTQYKVWKFAAKLFKMAMKRQPKNWKNSYMLAKCYWKMYQTPVADLDTKDQNSRVKLETLIDALKTSVEVAHKNRKSRSNDVVLEPHYKIISVLHKLVTRGDIPSLEAATILSEQPFGIVVDPDDHFASFSEPEDWEEYVIRSLTKLRDRDKSNWQHRIIMRHACILFNEKSPASMESDSYVEAKASFNILRESMFTKTMVMNVWKCDAERPGRHHVYTERYMRFMTKLLINLSDRVNMEQLLRRLRKKGADFYHFVDLWHTCCLAYVKMLRDTYGITHSTDEVFKSMSNEEFEIITERITEWASAQGPMTPTFSCMKDAIELKKLNASLTRVAPIDDLINDCYSKIYLDVARSLPGPEPAKVIEERNQAKEAVAKENAAKAEAEAATAATGELQPKALNGLLPTSEAQDSRGATPTPHDSEKPEAGPRARRAGIRRPEVLRKAEQAVMRSMEPKAGSVKARSSSVMSKRGSQRGSQTPAAAMSEDDSGSGSEEEGPDAQVRREAAEGVDTEVKETDAESLHDQDHEQDHDQDLEQDHEHEHEEDDDDSDLSDVPEGYDDDMPDGLLFANLRGHAAHDESSGEDADSESEGEEDDLEDDETALEHMDEEQDGADVTLEHMDEDEDVQEEGQETVDGVDEDQGEDHSRLEQAHRSDHEDTEMAYGDDELTRGPEESEGQEGEDDDDEERADETMESK